MLFLPKQICNDHGSQQSRIIDEKTTTNAFYQRKPEGEGHTNDGGVDHSREGGRHLTHLLMLNIYLYLFAVKMY